MWVWAALWGVAYGEFFGNFLEHLGVFYAPGHGEGLIRILIPRADTVATANTLILVSIAFGVFQVFHGFYVRARLALAHHHTKHFWEAVGYMGGLFGLILVAYSFLTGASNGFLTALTVAGFVLFFLGIVLSRVWLMLPELATIGGHVLSYIRIYAVGIAGALMANLATDLGFAIAERLGLLGLLVGLIAGLLVHGLILLLTTLGHVLQPIRLVWVEFFTKFGFYEESGRPYRPFKSVRSDAV